MTGRAKTKRRGTQNDGEGHKTTGDTKRQGGQRNDGEGNETTGNGDNDEGTTPPTPRMNDDTRPAPASRATACGVDRGGYGRQANPGRPTNDGRAVCPPPPPPPHFARGGFFFFTFNYLIVPLPLPRISRGEGFSIYFKLLSIPLPCPHISRGEGFFYIFLIT
jgi:hypothetical protein